MGSAIRSIRRCIPADEASLVEALQGHADTVISARHLAQGLPVCVSSVTMKPPFNQTASEEETPPPPGELPPAVDPRQMALFCAAWTLGSLAALTRGGAASATYYETLGWGGLIEIASGSRLPDKFLSQPGMLFPVYHVFADLAAAGAVQGTPLATNRPLAVTGLRLDSSAGPIYLLANLTPRDPIRHTGGPPAGTAAIRRLNEHTAAGGHVRSHPFPFQQPAHLNRRLFPVTYPAALRVCPSGN